MILRQIFVCVGEKNALRNRNVIGLERHQVLICRHFLLTSHLKKGIVSFFGSMKPLKNKSLYTVLYLVERSINELYSTTCPFSLFIKRWLCNYSRKYK